MKQPVFLFDGGLVVGVLELVKFLILADVMQNHLGVDARRAPPLLNRDHARDVRCEVVVMVHDLDLEALVMVRLLSALGGIFYAQDIFLVDGNVFLLVDHVFDYVGMAEVSLIQRRLKVGVEGGATCLRFLVVKVVVPI